MPLETIATERRALDQSIQSALGVTEHFWRMHLFVNFSLPKAVMQGLVLGL
jgi:hypothetical protein